MVIRILIQKKLVRRNIIIIGAQIIIEAIEDINIIDNYYLI